MQAILLRHCGRMAVLFGTGLLAVGCNQSEEKGAQATDATVRVAKADDNKESVSKHTGWWCDEHGVPEAVCGQCSGKVAAECKKKGDWCKEHDRPDSQCFVCHPELKEKFVVVYRAKYGKEPPPMEEPTKEDKK